MSETLQNTSAISRPREAAAEDSNKDLGIGTRALSRSTARFLNPDGSYNAVRQGLPFWGSLSLYHWLLSISWPAFFAVVSGGYLLTNLIFATGYMLCGADALQGLSDAQTPEEPATAKRTGTEEPSPAEKPAGEEPTTPIGEPLTQPGRLPFEKSDAKRPPLPAKPNRWATWSIRSTRWVQDTAWRRCRASGKCAALVRAGW